MNVFLWFLVLFFAMAVEWGMKAASAGANARNFPGALLMITGLIISVVAFLFGAPVFMYLVK